MKFINLFLFVALSIIWGSSFILMKEGMMALTPYQVAAIRIFCAGIVLLPFAIKALRQLPRQKIPVIILAGLLGSFFPAFLFCIAETKIDSSLAGILNALTPLFTILIGVFFFDLQAGKQKIIGVTVGFVGLVLLFIGHGHPDTKNLPYTFLVLLATLMYGVNVNLVGRYMKEVGSFNIAIIAFSFLTVPCVIILFFTGYFDMDFTNKVVIWSTTVSAILGVMGTALANILFYMLLKRAGPLFASTVTYAIPLVAVGWGIFYGEKISLLQVYSLVVILIGVYMANANKNPMDTFRRKNSLSKDVGPPNS